LLQADRRTKGESDKAKRIIAGILRCKCAKYKCMRRMLISINHVLFEGCRSWLAVMYGTPLTAKAPSYLEHATMNSRSLFSTGKYEQLLPVTYSMPVTTVAPCSLQHTTMNSRSLFYTGQYEQLLPVTYSMSVTIAAPCSLQQVTNSIAPCYLQHTTMNSRSLFCSESHYEKLLPPCSYVRTGSIKCPYHSHSSNVKNIR
jgi:hypothetical protein